MIIDKKLMATFMVFAMLAVCIIPAVGGERYDAESGDGGTYTYTIVYDETIMATGTNSISVDGMDAIFEPSYNVLNVTLENDGTTGYGSWTWDMETGLGPFNSFYGAFDIDRGNILTARLNPFDLSKTIDGYDLPSGHRYNIMWVLPTVYWKIGEVTMEVEVAGESDTTTTEEVTYPTLTLTNDSTAGGTAYAHTINGHVYNYVAYGVYEGYNDTITDGDTTKTVLTSQTDKAPTRNVNRDTFRIYAHNYTMNTDLSMSNDNPAYSMIWNFYQWELYKYCSLTLMEDFNSQATVGNGKVYTTDNNVRYNETGELDISGPYAGTIGAIGTAETSPVNGIDSVKLFLENSWGSLSEFVDGVVFNYTEIYSNSVPDSATTVDIYIQTKDTPDNYYGPDTTGTDTFTEKITLSSRYHPEDASADPAKLSPTVIDKGQTKTLDDTKATTEDDPIDPTITGSGYPLHIITNDARLWGFGDELGGSATTGMSDYEWIPNATGPRVVDVGGISSSDVGSAPRYGLSAVFSDGGLGYSGVRIGARLAFVFDVDTTSNERTVTFSNYPAYGNVYDETDTLVTSVDVPLGSQITVDPVNTDTIMIGYRTFEAKPIDATAQYTYSFLEWDDAESLTTVESNMTIRADYGRTVNSYTITWDVDGVTDTTSVQYGKMPTHETPTKDYYKFNAWTPKLVKVTGTATYTATWTPIDYTVTWDPTGGTVSPRTSTGNVETAITEYPTPTRDGYTFAGWFTAPEGGEQIAESIYPNANVTYYAQWTPITYTVIFDAGEGTSASASLTGSQMAPLTLPTATLADSYLAGWYTLATGGKLVGYAGTMIYPAEDTTLYAQWSDTEVFGYSLNLLGNGGYDAPSAMLYSTKEDGTHTFVIPMAEPKRAGMYFQGWATTSGATEAEYVAGDTIVAEANTPITLYAVWGDEPSPSVYDWLGSVILIVVIVGLLLSIVAIFFNRESFTTTQLVTAIVGITIGVIVVVTVLAPIVGLL